MRRFPFANLAYFRVIYAHHKREEDLEHRLEALRKASVPDWPYGYQPRLEDRLDRDSLEALTFGQHLGQGMTRRATRFVQEFNDDGRVAFRGRASLLVGTARLKARHALRQVFRRLSWTARTAVTSTGPHMPCRKDRPNTCAWRLGISITSRWPLEPF